ncbi:MAG: hypothetical protein AB1726_13435 [Planctomycetota bacterium]
MLCELLLVAGPLLRAPLAAPPAADDLTDWLPADPLLVIEAPRPRALFEPLLDAELAAVVTSLPPWQAWAASPEGREFWNVVRTLEATLGLDWRTALARLAGGGAVLAVAPPESLLLVLEAEDADLLLRLHTILLGFARAEAAREGDASRLDPVRHGDVEVWSFDGKEVHAIVGNRLLFANRREGLVAALERRAASPGARLAGAEGWRAARATAGPDAAVRLYADLARLKENPGFARGLEEGRANPLAALLFAGIVEAMREASWLSAGLAVADEGFVLRAVVDGAADDPASPAAFARPDPADAPALPSLAVPGRLAAIGLHRDLHGFYAAKDELFPERTSSLIFFENMMGIFFTGRDLTDEVLAETRPGVRLVVAEQRHDPAAGVPEVRIPAFAAVLALRDAGEFGEVIEEAWQKALGLVNFTRGQDALPGLILDRGEQNGTKLTIARFSTAGIDDRAHLPPRFNYSPTLALPQNHLVLSSTEGLARDLVDALARGAGAGPEAGDQDDRVELDGAGIGAALAANREALVRSNMIDEGHTREEAELEIGALLALIGFVDEVDLRVGRRGATTGARLDVHLRRPAAPAPAGPRDAAPR